MSFWSTVFGVSNSSPESLRVKELLASGQARIIDVRTPAEFASGHVSGAINLPVSDLANRMKEIGPKETPVVLYCRSGARSASAASMLRSAGFQEIFDIGPMAAFPR